MRWSLISLVASWNLSRGLWSDEVLCDWSAVGPRAHPHLRDGFSQRSLHHNCDAMVESLTKHCLDGLVHDALHLQRSC